MTSQVTALGAASQPLILYVRRVISLNHLRRALVAVGVIACTALGTAASPAAAAPQAGAPQAGAPLLKVEAPPRVDLAQFASDVFASVKATYLNATGAKLTIDLSDVGFVSVVPDTDGCVPDDRKLVCTMRAGRGVDGVYMLISAASTATAGATGVIRYSLTADGVPDAVTAQTTVAVAEGVVDLVLGGYQGPKEAKPGEAVTAPLRIFNAGDQAARGLDVTASIAWGIDPVLYDNCRYSEQWRQILATCTFDDVLEPGKAYEITDATGAPAFRGVVKPDALGRQTFHISAYAQNAAPAAVGSTDLNPTRSGRHASLRPVRSQGIAELNSKNNWVSFDFEVDNGYDLAIEGAEVSAAIGDAVDVTITVHNRGSGSIYRGSYLGSPAYFLFTVPEGTVVGSPVPENCGYTDNYWGYPGPLRPKYVCRYEEDFFAAGASFRTTFKIRLREGEATPGDHLGQATLMGGAGWELEDKLTNDDDLTNNAAPVLVHATLPPSAAGPDDGELPVTGAPVGTAVAAGLVLVVAGGLVYRATRRRRLRDV